MVMSLRLATSVGDHLFDPLSGTRSQDAILIRCRTRRPAVLEQNKALQKADLLEAVFKRAVEIQWHLQ